MSEHYDPDIQAMKDYEALNADTALQLNKAKQEIERLQGELDASHTNNLILAEENLSQEKEIERLQQEREGFRQGFINAGCEAERLRAALERIVNDYRDFDPHQLANIAREALND